jgi:hypothetical protein
MEPLEYFESFHHRTTDRGEPTLPSILYDLKFEEYLIRLGLYSISIMDDCHIDKALISILIER